MQPNELVQKIASLLWDRKALDIVALDVRGLTVLCDYMVIASGRNVNQVKGLYDDVDDMMAKEGVQLRRSEGSAEGRWVVLDYSTILVHIFHQEERAFYNLERLWDDGTNRLTLPFDQTQEA
ncbi:MAG: ribosome silencing factor [Clostridia bacterium]|nr:ribosome silencing factor [Clostridia bacterium]